MATYTVSTNHNGVGSGLSADVADVGGGKDAPVAGLLCSGVGAAHGSMCFWTLTSAAPEDTSLTAFCPRTGTSSVLTVPAAGASTASLRLPAGGPSVLELSAQGATDSVKLISSGTPKVSVERAL